jgi:hypothetical protein
MGSTAGRSLPAYVNYRNPVPRAPIEQAVGKDEVILVNQSYRHETLFCSDFVLDCINRRLPVRVKSYFPHSSQPQQGRKPTFAFGLGPFSTETVDKVLMTRLSHAAEAIQRRSEPIA